MSLEEAKKTLSDMACNAFDQGALTFRDAWIEILETMNKDRTVVPIEVLLRVLKDIQLPSLADCKQEEKQ